MTWRVTLRVGDVVEQEVMVKWMDYYDNVSDGSVQHDKSTYDLRAIGIGPSRQATHSLRARVKRGGASW